MGFRGLGSKASEMLQELPEASDNGFRRAP